MTELTHNSSPGRADWHGELPRLSLLAFVGLLIVVVGIASACAQMYYEGDEG
jgi:hypothetical protein